MASCALAVFGLSAKELNQGRRSLALSTAFFPESLSQDDSISIIKVTLEPTIAALDALAFLPKTMCLVSKVWMLESLIKCSGCAQSW